ncbi:phosphatidylinositol-4-phosphate 5-kinase [Lentinula edodes]|nr:phosphatidylinositol-4-phosphate 5-kinase [Lentinula edodes]
MENLFYDQKIDKTFDLKGIQGRKVKSGNNVTVQTSKTLFDGEWIEGQQQTLTLVRPHSKAVLREAIRSDAEFLSKSNIMDYSLLLGIDTEHKQIACGLVDTIGPYTFAKTLEYKAKQGLNSGNGKEVTVIPPAEYQERFTNALERYFLACPGKLMPSLDKWSRSLDRRKMISNPDLLPSVL